MEPHILKTPPGFGARGLARHAAWNYVAMLAPLVSGFVNTAIAFREVDTSRIGVYAIAITSMAILAVADPSIAYGVTRSTARLIAHQDAPKQLRFIHAAHAVLTAIGCIVSVVAAGAGVLAWSIGAIRLPMQAWVMLGFLAGAFLLQLLTAVLPAVAIGMEDFRGNAIASVILAGTSLLVVLTTIRTLDIAALGLGQFGGMLMSRASLLLWSRRRAPWLVLRPERPRWVGMASLVMFSGPMLLMALAGQFLAWADVVSVGALVGASASALYRVGSLVPTQASGILWRAYDVVFPVLSRSSDEDQERATALLIKIFSALAGVGFAAMIVMRQDVILLMTGGTSDLAQFVLLIFCLVWAINVPAHGISLLAIARGRHGIYVPIIISEMATNVALTLVLVAMTGARGAAIATLVTISVSNLVAIPLVLRRYIPSSMKLIVWDGIIPLAAYGLTTFALLSLLQTFETSVIRLPSQVACTVVCALLALVSSGGSTGRRALRSSLRPHGGL